MLLHNHGRDITDCVCVLETASESSQLVIRINEIVNYCIAIECRVSKCYLSGCVTKCHEHCCVTLVSYNLIPISPLVTVQVAVTGNVLSVCKQCPPPWLSLLKVQVQLSIKRGTSE